nr:unnamed protein product [Callosobruchus chinensis]
MEAGTFNSTQEAVTKFVGISIDKNANDPTILYTTRQNNRTFFRHSFRGRGHNYHGQHRRFQHDGHYNNINTQPQHRCDKMDQDCRKNNLRIFNMVEEERENIPQKIVELVNTKMGFTLTEGDIQSIFNNKKLLKGTRIVIKEDLTTLRVNLMSRVIVKTSLKSAWTSEGKIYVKYNGKICKIVSNNDFDKIFS